MRGYMTGAVCGDCAGHRLRIESRHVFLRAGRLNANISDVTAMTIDQAIMAATLGGAAALRRDDLGRIVPGGPAHLAILDAPSRHHLAYRPGVPLIWRTIGSDYRLSPNPHTSSTQKEHE